MSVRRTSGFWHLKKRCCWPWVLYLVLAKEIRWMGIAPEMPWNLGEKPEASKNLVKHHHRASLPPRLSALSTLVASAATSDIYCLLSINSWMPFSDTKTQWLVQGHVLGYRTEFTAPSSGSLYSCFLPHHQTGLWLAFYIHPIQMLEPGRQTQGSTVSENVCPGTIWFCLGFFHTKMIRRE